MKTYKITGTITENPDGSETTVFTKAPVPNPVDPVDPIDPVDPPPTPGRDWITRFDFQAGDIPKEDMDALQLNERYDFGESALVFRDNPDNGKMRVAAGSMIGQRDKWHTWKHQNFLPEVDAWIDRNGSGAGTPWYQPYGERIRYTIHFTPLGFPPITPSGASSWVIPFQFYPGRGQTPNGGQNPMFAPYATNVNGGTKWVLRFKAGDRTLPSGTQRPGPGEIRRELEVPFSQHRQTWIIEYLAHETDGEITVSVDGERGWLWRGCTTVTTTAESAKWGPAPLFGSYTYASPSHGYGFAYHSIKIEQDEKEQKQVRTLESYSPDFHLVDGLS